MRFSNGVDQYSHVFLRHCLQTSVRDLTNLKTPILESLSIKIEGLQSCNFLKKSLQHWCFHIAKSWIEEHLQRTASVDIPSHAQHAIYMFRVNNRNTRTRCEMCLKLTKKPPEWRQWRHSGEHVSHLVLVFLLLILSR